MALFKQAFSRVLQSQQKLVPAVTNASFSTSNAVNAADLRTTVAEKIPAMQEEVKAFRKSHGRSGDVKKEEKQALGEALMAEIGDEFGSSLRVPGHKWSSSVPDVCLTEECILGIDEAGRGPVLGPMVYGTCYIPRSLESKLKDMGCMDSKMLTEGKREILFAELNSAASSSICGWGVTVLPPSWICESQLKRCKYNLNTISHDTAMGLIQGVIDKGVNLVAVFLDTVGDPTKYADLIKSRFPHLEVTVEKKADSTFPCVSAASIAAKVSRDAIVNRWSFAEGVSPPSSGYGSGYPADPNSKKFLTQTFDPVFGFSSFVRFSWSTISLILNDKAHAVRWEDDDEEGAGKKSKKAEKPAGVSSLTKFFPSKSKRKASDDDDDDDENDENDDNRVDRKAKENHENKRHRFFALKSLQLERTSAKS